jgi:hypothetical protein
MYSMVGVAQVIFILENRHPMPVAKKGENELKKKKQNEYAMVGGGGVLMCLCDKHSS